MKTKILRHFPENKSKFKKYLFTFLPIILGSTFFALNGVIDNFMVGHIEQGQSALGAVNSWTAILVGYLMGTSAVGSVLSSQFFHANKLKIVREISHYRYYLAIIGAVPLAIVAWVNPDILANTFLSKPDPKNLVAVSNYNLTMDNARAYTKVIAIQWLLLVMAFNYGNQLRELGYGKVTMFWGIGTLTTNITLNALLMYVYHFGVEGAAWASVAGRVVSSSVGILFVYFKKLPISFIPWKIWQVSWATRKIFWKRWVYFFAVVTVILFIQLRTVFYSRGYPFDNSNLGQGVSGLAVVALSGALMNVFTTTFNALSSMAAIYVASELGKNNIEQAKKNSDELKGFNTMMAVILSLLMVVFASLLPYMSFLSETTKTFDGHAHLLQVKYAMYVIAWYYPFWIWFSTSYRNGNAGGKGGYFALTDWIVTGLQVGWAAVVMLGIVPHSEFMRSNFWLAYAIFFLSDYVKMFFTELFYYKTSGWLHSITKNETESIKSSAKDDINNEINNEV